MPESLSPPQVDIAAERFFRRFSIHILPQGFMNPAIWDTQFHSNSSALACAWESLRDSNPKTVKLNLPWQEWLMKVSIRPMEEAVQQVHDDDAVFEPEFKVSPAIKIYYVLPVRLFIHHILLPDFSSWYNGDFVCIKLNFIWLSGMNNKKELQNY
jgi:hypothetical protein